MHGVLLWVCVGMGVCCYGCVFLFYCKSRTITMEGFQKINQNMKNNMKKMWPKICHCANYHKNVKTIWKLRFHIQIKKMLMCSLHVYQLAGVAAAFFLIVTAICRDLLIMCSICRSALTSYRGHVGHTYRGVGALPCVIRVGWPSGSRPSNTRFKSRFGRSHFGHNIKQ